MWTRPARPRAPPCDTTYGAVHRPVSIIHWAAEALKLPVTGSSTVIPFSSKNVRT